MFPVLCFAVAILLAALFVLCLPAVLSLRLRAYHRKPAWASPVRWQTPQKLDCRSSHKAILLRLA